MSFVSSLTASSAIARIVDTRLDCSVPSSIISLSRSQLPIMTDSLFIRSCVTDCAGMSYPAQLAFLSKLDATAFPPNTIFVFTCNAVDSLEGRFLSRCRRVDFSSYGMSEGIIGLLQRVWDAETRSSDTPNFARLAKDSANNVRDALMALEVELLSAA